MRYEHKPSPGGAYDMKPYFRLAHEIVLQAVWDWRRLVDAHAWLDEAVCVSCNFTELRQFFKSEYCEFLLMGSETTPADILRKLEMELEAKREECERGNPKG